MTSPSTLLTAGIAPEPAYGQLSVPTVGVPVTAFAAVDVPGLLPDQSWRGSVGDSSGHTLGTVDATVQFGGPLLADVIGFPLAGLLGDVQCVGHGAPYRWSMSALNSGAQQPGSYTLTESTPAGPVAYPGARFSSLAISAASPAALIVWSAQAGCLAGVPSTAAVPRFGQTPAFPAWMATATIGEAFEATVESFTLTFARTVIPKRNTDGSLAPTIQRASTLTVGGQMTVVALADSYRQQLVAGQPTSIALTVGQGVGTRTTLLTVTSSLVYLASVTRLYGRKWVELGLSWLADQNPTDAGPSGGLSPVKVDLSNALAAGAY